MKTEGWEVGSFFCWINYKNNFIYGIPMQYRGYLRTEKSSILRAGGHYSKVAGNYQSHLLFNNTCFKDKFWPPLILKFSHFPSSPKFFGSMNRNVIIANNRVIVSSYKFCSFHMCNQSQNVSHKKASKHWVKLYKSFHV